MPAAQAITAFTRVSKSVPTAQKRKASDDHADGYIATRTFHARPAKRQSLLPPPVDQENEKTSDLAPKERLRAKRAHRPSESTLLSKTNEALRKVQAKHDAAHKKRQQVARSHELQLPDLLSMHKAFLKTAVLHVAHSGATAPIDIAALAPNMARSWGKRRVTVDDVRRCVALEAPDSPFVVCDYGKGRMCVELVPGATVDEQALARRFEENVRASIGKTEDGMDMDVDVPLQSLSLAELPRAQVTDMATGRTNPLLSKGQRALESFKAKPREEVKPVVETRHPDGRKMSLLDRLKAKEMARQNGPSGLSGPELERRAALNRVVDVAATLSMLSLSTMSLPRQAFTMANITDKLRDSLRVPLSKEEGISCVKLIAKEVAPEWIRIVALGGRENVVIQRTGQPVDRVILERVQKLLQ